MESSEAIAAREFDVEPAPKRRPLWWSYILRDKKAFVGLVVLAVLVFAAVTAPLIAPYDPNSMEFDMLEPPSWAHPLGTARSPRRLRPRCRMSRPCQTVESSSRTAATR